MDAVEVLRSGKCRLQWKYIVFKHNQHQIKQAKELSVELGFDSFKLEHSDRWLGKKELMPDREYVDAKYQQQEKVLIDKNPVGSIISGTVNSSNDYALYLKLDGYDIDAFLHCNDLTYLSKGEEELAKYKKNDKIKESFGCKKKV